MDESAKWLLGRSGHDDYGLDRRGDDAWFGVRRRPETYGCGRGRAERHLVGLAENRDAEPVLATIRVLGVMPGQVDQAGDEWGLADGGVTVPVVVLVRSVGLANRAGRVLRIDRYLELG
jgi:hypothetical protein